MHPLVIAYHLIWTGYGWWLPNDPRGSSSTCIRSDVLSDLGELHFGRKRVQPFSREIRSFYDKAGAMLQFSLILFTDEMIRTIGEAFGQAIAGNKYT